MTAPQIFAHRGFADTYPENTVGAVRAAAKRTDAVEIDVRRCGTGELVVFHDDELDRVTDGEGRIDETSLGTLKRLTVADSREPIPTFDELLAAVPDGVLLNVELKEDGIGEEVVNACRAHGTDALYSSFYDDAIREIRAVAPDAPLAVLCHKVQPIDERLALAGDLDAEAFHPSMELVETWSDPGNLRLPAALERLDAGLDTEETIALGSDVVALAHAFGLRVNVWTAETPSDVVGLRERGVDGIMVDDPNLVAKRAR
ncbi:glycerophosphodiester phosphodiesterase [Halorubrum vacuolatum]|uniref:Glycerophosphoryl diester phosphodiesterase n=1 Tax=Halorubrum vacuolatum TaxID=63740 RepID=A0A238VDS1_HALVU|nr:glycerophosphodiester phosphodiesterase [Halorubrum vacuolatum]SNR32351.1 glycerophosphoryl diester phosphodiesterase [Halorubrum vacuolatum]